MPYLGMYDKRIVWSKREREFIVISSVFSPRLRSRRKVIGPNYGFLVRKLCCIYFYCNHILKISCKLLIMLHIFFQSQLKLYEKMKFCIDKNNHFYKLFRLHVAADKVKSGKLIYYFQKSAATYLAAELIL
jgi:hypothetical protein